MGKDERPEISNVQIVDLDRDGLADILVCDVVRNRVAWIRQFPKGVFTETGVGGSIQAPAHVEAIDFDKDGDLDLVVASLGVLNPSNNRVGAVVVLENDGHQHFSNHVVAEHIARVADGERATWTATAIWTCLSRVLVTTTARRAGSKTKEDGSLSSTSC